MSKHPTAEEQAALMMMRATHSLRAIIRHTDRAPSPVSRKPARHTINLTRGYDASLSGPRARLMRQQPRQRSRLPPDGELWEVVAHLMPGHREGDIIMGAYHRSAIGTLVKHTTQLVSLVKREGATVTATAGFSNKFNEVPRSLRLSMTYDRGNERVKHAEITQKMGTTIYLVDPCSPWQRGSYENIKSLIRRYLPGAQPPRSTVSRALTRSPIH